jgi:hypothetical protein
MIPSPLQERLPQIKRYDLQETGTYETLDGIHLTSSSARALALVIRKIVDAKGQGARSEAAEPDADRWRLAIN